MTAPGRASLYQDIVDNALAATGARLVHLAWLDPASGRLRTGAMSGSGARWYEEAIAAIRMFLPGFEPSAISYAVGTNSVHEKVYREAKTFQGELVEIASGAVDERVLRVAVSLAGLRHAVVCPLTIGREVVGSLAFCADTPFSPALTTACEAFARQASLTVENARLREHAERARSELETILDAADDAILVVGLDGRLIRANETAERWFANRLGAQPVTVDEFRRLARPELTDGAPPPMLGVEQALRGQSVTEELVVASFGGARRIHVISAPLREPGGALSGAVVVARDITDLHDSIAERSRLDGAIKTARLAAHELSNKLSYLTGYGELLAGQLSGDAAEQARIVAEGAHDAARTLLKLQEIIRFEEAEFGGQMMLDLEASTEPGEGQRSPG